MKKIFLFSLCFVNIVSANLFVVTDKQGNIIQKSILIHKDNAFLKQNATEYSLQAISDELNKVQRHARLALLAKKHFERINLEKSKASKAGKTYHISKDDRKKLIEDAKYYKGGKYVWGGTTPEGFDCSGYVQYLYKKHKIELPRTAYAQSKKGYDVALKDIQKGDLMFFLTDKERGIPITHVGIYLGEGQFIHAASKKKGIIISPIAQGYYRDKFVSARRIATKA